MIRLENILNTSFKEVWKMFLQDVLKTSWQDVLKMSWRGLENVLNKSWRRISKTNIWVLIDQDVFNTSWRRLEDVWLRRIYSSWSRRLQDECLVGRCTSSYPEVFLRKGVLKICCKFTGEHPCHSAISTNLLCSFIEIAIRHRCSPVNLPHIFRTPFPWNTLGWLLLKVPFAWWGKPNLLLLWALSFFTVYFAVVYLWASFAIFSIYLKFILLFMLLRITQLIFRWGCRLLLHYLSVAKSSGKSEDVQGKFVKMRFFLENPGETANHNNSSGKLKKRLWHRCFPVNFTKFLRTPFLKNTSGRLLLHELQWISYI